MWITTQSREILCIEYGHVVLKIPSVANGLKPESPSIVEEKAGQVMFCFPNKGFLRVRDGKVESITEGFVPGENGKVVKDGLGQVWFSLGSQGFGTIKADRLCFLETLRVDQLAGAHSGGVWICSGNHLPYLKPEDVCIFLRALS